MREIYQNVVCHLTCSCNISSYVSRTRFQVLIRFQILIVLGIVGNSSFIFGSHIEVYYRAAFPDLHCARYVRSDYALGVSSPKTCSCMIEPLKCCETRGHRI